MNCTIVFLKEQKYMGIKTKILFKDHNETDFHQLHLDVLDSDIRNIDVSERFMALDSDFQTDSFSYTPLVPVTSFEEDGYFKFTRMEGEYYCFPVQVKELGPKWFQDCSEYIKQNCLKVDREFDLEYYAEDYFDTVRSKNSNLADQTIQLIFRKLD